MKSRAEYECGAGGLLDGARLNDQLPRVASQRWLLASERSRTVEWLGAAAFAWLIIAAVRHDTPQNTIRWITEMVAAIFGG